jgi:hypothetical protein
MGNRLWVWESRSFDSQVLPPCQFRFCWGSGLFEVATFQVEFTWNPRTSHGQNDHTPETQRRKSTAGRTSSTGRALSSRVDSTAEEVRGDEYFQNEKILDSQQRGRRREYRVKWQGYGREHDCWEPDAHFEKCPDVLQQFHQRTGLSITKARHKSNKSNPGIYLI